MKKKALIAMSGGVDSSTAAGLMAEMGYECIGCTMCLFGSDPGEGRQEAVEDASEAAEALGIPFHVFRFEEAFRRHVILPFIQEYRDARTPNPCVECNRCLKFGLLFEKMKELGCDCLVTGHYARVCFDENKGRYLLMKASDPKKDQSYVLYSLTQEHLAHVRFPLGELSKGDVRKIAGDVGLRAAEKPESQDICFIPDGDYAGFIRRFERSDGSGKGEQPGDFIDREGCVLGRHRGIIHYTLGQRRHLGIPAANRLYVTAIDPETNTVTLGTNDDLFAPALTAGNINLISTDRIENPMRVWAKVRYRHTAQPAYVTQTGDDTIQVVFDEPQRAITPGQSVVLYDGDIVVGGGVIREVLTAGGKI